MGKEIKLVNSVAVAFWGVLPPLRLCNEGRRKRRVIFSNQIFFINR